MSVIKGFLSASFGFDEAALRQALINDYTLKDADIRAGQDTATGTRVLAVSLPSFKPFEAPVTIRYTLGYTSHTLTQIDVGWKLQEPRTAERQDAVMAAISQLKKHLSEREWLADQKVTDRVTGEVTAGAELPFTFFQGTDASGAAATLSGEPVRIQADENNTGEFRSDFTVLRSVHLLCQIDSTNPDVRES